MDDITRYLIVSMEGETFAIPITSLLEITVPRRIQKDTNQAKNIEGSIEYRGNVIPVVDLKKVLKMSGEPGSSLIVLKTAKGTIGVLADTANELMTSAGPPYPMPRGVMSPGQTTYAGIIRNREDLVLLLSEDGLLS